MGNFSRPPCDEAAILAGTCELPATKNGPWILAADHPRFQHGLHRWHRRKRRPPRAASGPRCHARPSAMGGGILCPFPGCAAPHWRIIGRSLRPPQDLHNRSSALLGCLRVVWTRAGHPALNPGARPPGNRRSAPRARKPGPHQRQFLCSRSAAAPSAHGPASRRSLPRSAPCWVDGSPSMARGDGSSSSIFPSGCAVLLLATWKVPESKAAQQTGRFDWPGGVLAARRFRRHRLWTDRIVCARSGRWRPHADRAVVLGGACLRRPWFRSASSALRISAEPTCSRSFCIPP